MIMPMATVASATKLITGEELLAMGDIGPCELIDGRIVPMIPAGGVHGVIEAKLAWRLGGFIEQNQLGFSMVGEVGIHTRWNPDRVRGADFAFWTAEQFPDGPPVGFSEVAPYLAIEIVSPSNSWEEIREKIAEYFSIGAEQVWIVEPANRAVLIYHTATQFSVLNEGNTITGEGLLAGFSLAVADLFQF